MEDVLLPRGSPAEQVNVDQEGTAGDDVGGSLATQASRVALAGCDGANGTHSGDRGSAGEHPSGSGDRRSLRLVAHGERAWLLARQDSNRDHLQLHIAHPIDCSDGGGEEPAAPRTLRRTTAASRRPGTS